MTIWNGLTSDGAVVPIQVDAQGRVIAVGSGPDSPLVVDGDYLRPRDETKGLGTANINLDASGAATFTGQVIVGSDDFYNKFYTSGTHEIYNKTWGPGQGNQNALDIKGSGGSVALVFGDGSATFAGIVDGLCITGRQDSTKSAVFRGTWDGAGNDFTSVVYGDGSALFGGDVVTGSFNPGLSTTAGLEFGVGGAVSVQRVAGSEPTDNVWRALQGTTVTSFITTGGNATFIGNVTAKNISAFSVVLKAALINSDTVQEIKTALTEALAALVPPDASTMPAPGPDASTMPAPPTPEPR